jgi:hypothetical protein
MCVPDTAQSFQTEGGRIMDAMQVVTNYHNAWTSGDVEGACVYLAADLDFQGSKKDRFGVLSLFGSHNRENNL